MSCTPERSCSSFQYHTGPIKRDDPRGHVPGTPRSSFNTTLVQLKAWVVPPMPPTPIPRFNTTLVQLKANRTGELVRKFVRFQYHTGPIKSQRWLSEHLESLTHFNTTLVQLKGG